MAQAFNTMQDRLGRADRARKAFIANATHELRTPLFSLGGYVELMREEELDEETQREFLDIMHDQIRRLHAARDRPARPLEDRHRLADDPARTGQPARPRAARSRASSTRASRNQDREITSRSHDDVEAYCDPDRVAQIARILVDNALSHTPAGTT